MGLERSYWPFETVRVEGDGWTGYVRGALPLSRWGAYFGKGLADQFRAHAEREPYLLAMLRRLPKLPPPAGGGRTMELRLR